MAMAARASGVPETMRAVEVAPGDPSPASMSVVEAPLPVLGDGELLIHVAATAVNRADTLQRKGRYPVPPGATQIMGLECSGTVVAGLEAEVGTEVMALLPGGGYAE